MKSKILMTTAASLFAALGAGKGMAQAGGITSSPSSTATGSTAGTVTPGPAAPIQSVDTPMGPSPSSGIDSSRLNNTAAQLNTNAASNINTVPNSSSNLAAAPANTGVTPSSANIIDVQQKLNAAGYDSGQDNGVLGTRTQAALQSYQSAQGLPVTGQLDAATMSHMGLSQPQAQPGTPAATSTNPSAR